MTAIRPRSTSGGPRSCCSVPMASGRSRSCAGRASRRPASGARQERFAEEGCEGLLRDKTRPPRIAPLGAEVAERVVALTLTDPTEATHWTATMMAKATGISVSSVQRIWRAHGLQPHRVRQFKKSRNAQFVAKLRDMIGLYVDPPAHAVVLSVDEKSQYPGARPDAVGAASEEGPRRHDDPRLQARHDDALRRAYLDGSVIGRNMARHRHQEFIRFLNAIETAVPHGQTSTSTRSSTTTPRTSTPKSASGSTATRAGPSTSCRHPPPAQRRRRLLRQARQTQAQARRL